MSVLDKINDYLSEKDKDILKQEIEYVYETEMDVDVKKRVVEGMIGGKGYDKFYKKTLAKYKVKSAKDLSDEDKKKFFNEIDKGWKAKKETD